ncbi:MAG: type II toxin-antitoxin system mRNA interferase toxin, RelE/StbE family [Armatimonadetes bacterium CP1_7O]|nr:MAG: type II toxin-antitoxin system mRNA interferase toxin, RelE/StbE family [Armatimonadetes bacterium CP1_7O]RMH09543.1 MAG: type II toxin-antitoxin system RelE/ParE family toxin [Armatimonadota bacterium]
MSYTVQILPRAQRQLAKLPAEVYPRVRDALRALADEPRPVGCRKLVGRAGWRLRVGSYRVIYEIDEEQRTVTILDIGHRREIYRE